MADPTQADLRAAFDYDPQSGQLIDRETGFEVGWSNGGGGHADWAVEHPLRGGLAAVNTFSGGAAAENRRAAPPPDGCAAVADAVCELEGR